MPHPDNNYADQLDMLKERGWLIAVHSQHKRDGLPYSSWLFIHPNGRWIKGEGHSDEQAVQNAYAQSLNVALEMHALHRLSSIERSGPYADAILDAYGSKPKGQLWDDLDTILKSIPQN